MERWLPVVGYEGLYEVSEAGKVRSLARVDRIGHCWPGRDLSCASDGGSYRYVTLHKDGSRRKVNVHILVLEAFVGPRPTPRHEACHEDGNPTNATLINLRWDVPEGNQQDKVRHGTLVEGSAIHCAKLTEELVGWIRESHQPSTHLAPIFDVSGAAIRNARAGKTWRFRKAARRALEHLNATPVTEEV